MQYQADESNQQVSRVATKNFIVESLIVSFAFLLSKQ